MRAHIVSTQIAVAVFALCEAVVAMASAGLGAMAWFRALVLAVALAGPVGALLGAVISIAVRAWPRASLPIGLVIGLPIGVAVWGAAHAGAVLLAAFRLHDPGLSAWAVALLAVTALPLGLVPVLAATRWLAPIDRRFPRAGHVALMVGCAAAVVLYSWSPLLAFGGVAVAVGVAIEPVAARVPRRLPATLAIVGALIVVSPLCDDPLLRRAHRDATAVPAVARALSIALDWDRDGALAVLGGGDCDEGNAGVGPHAVEIAGDGIDQDCQFGDLIERQASVGAHPRARAVFLLSVSDLDIDAGGQLSPALPALQARIERGVRFATAVGVAGDFRDVAPVLTDGVLPPVVGVAHSGFATHASSIPALLERRGGSALLAAEKKIIADLSTQFVGKRTRAVKKTTAAISAAGTNLADNSFTWLHVRLGRTKKRAGLDAALAKLLDRVLGSRATVIVVGLPSGRSATPAIAGGPLAIIGGDLTPRIEERAVGLFDVYPTLAGLLDLHPPVTPPGDSLLAIPDRAGALVGDVFRDEVLGASDGERGVLYDPRRRRFSASNDSGALIAQVTGSLLGPRLARANRALAESVATALPRVMDGTPMLVARALTVHGCTVRDLGSRHVEVRVYMSGGEALRPADLLLFKLSSAHRGSTRGRLVPGGGTRPFGSWQPGELVVERLDLDVRRLRQGTATLWIGVERRGKPLPITGGSGSTPTWGRVCAVEIK